MARLGKRLFVPHTYTQHFLEGLRGIIECGEDHRAQDQGTREEVRKDLLLAADLLAKAAEVWK